MYLHTSLDISLSMQVATPLLINASLLSSYIEAVEQIVSDRGRACLAAQCVMHIRQRMPGKGCHLPPAGSTDALLLDSFHVIHAI